MLVAEHLMRQATDSKVPINLRILVNANIKLLELDEAKKIVLKFNGRDLYHADLKSLHFPKKHGIPFEVISISLKLKMKAMKWVALVTSTHSPVMITADSKNRIAVDWSSKQDSKSHATRSCFSVPHCVL